MPDANVSGQRVLVVDDDAAMQALFATLLKRHGLECDVVGDGERALQQLHSVDYSAVVLDLMLPRTNGFEVIRHLKCLAPEILNRIIVVTAASERTLKAFDSIDVRVVLRKPFDIDEFIAGVRTCMTDGHTGATESDA